MPCQNKNDNRYKYFLKKLEDIKVKTKCDELKYLIYIDNQQKKIADLENQLKIKHHENLSNEVLKSIRCFPNFVQYNFKEDINPKTLPLHEFLLTYENPKKKSAQNLVKILNVVNQLKLCPRYSPRRSLLSTFQ